MSGSANDCWQQMSKQPANSSSKPNPQPAQAKMPARLRALLFVGALLPALLFVALGAYVLHASYRQFEDRAELLTQSLAQALETSVTANVEKIDMALSSIVDHMESQLRKGPLDLDNIEAHVHSQTALRPELESIRVTDAGGVGIAGPGMRKLAKPFSFADREWFTVQRDRNNAGLHMSKPLVGKVDGVWIVSFSRRYRNPDGSFAGGVSAAVPLSYFTRQLASLNVGPHGSVALRNAQLGLLTRLPNPGGEKAEPVGSTKVSPQLQKMAGSGVSQGSYLATSPLDGIERSYTFRRLSVVPLMVVVGASSEDYLADWYGQAWTVGGLCVAILLLYGVGGALLRRTLASNRAANQRIELLAKVFDSSGEAIMVTDREHRIVEVNPAFERQSGYATHEIIGHFPSMLDSARTTQADHELIRTAVAQHGYWRGELWDRTKNGREYPKWLSISVLRDAAGEVTHHIASSIDVTDVKQAEDRIRHLAHHDTLTQLPNRVLLHGRLEQAMAAAHRDSSGLAMLFIDMDRFKNINDTLGHPVGDGLLVEVAQRLRALVRDSDIVARLGGDEFVLVLTGLEGDSARAAAAVAGKVIAELGKPYGVRGHELHSTPSIGIGLFPADGEDADTLMKNADSAMYHAKSVGRNNFQFFTNAMNQATTERLALEAGLRGAIERGELFLNYQPQLDLPTSEVVAFEALVRWRHPEMGLIPPLKFIPVAEDTGQIEAIGAWVLNEALRQVALWRRAGHHDLRMAVNLSAQQLRGDGFAQQIAQALQSHQLPGQALELEITESVAMRDPTRTAELLRELRQHGVALAIDDFGTGYSSLAYLKQLPLSCLKLDRSFVMDIETDPNDAAICTATIQLAHSLGLGVVAEGVETQQQLDFLRRLGCDTVQGYFISRPVPAADCERFLRKPVVDEIAAPA